MPRRTSALADGPRALAALALVALVVLGAATATPWRVRPPEALLEAVPGPAAPAPAPTLSPAATPEPPAAPGSTDLGLVALLAVLLVLAVVLALVGRRILSTLRDAEPRHDPDTVEVGASVAEATAPAVSVDELQDAVTRALRRLDQAATPHDAVVAAWVSLEEAAARHGTARDPAQTPTEFTVELLHDTPAPPDPVATLRRLYHHARFTDRPVARDEVAAAREALVHIASALDDHATAPRAGQAP